jgi:hypothetical protein
LLTDLTAVGERIWLVTVASRGQEKRNVNPGVLDVGIWRTASQKETPDGVPFCSVSEEREQNAAP